MPSIPQSLLWISLVVLWLFVLVPMLINKRDAVRRTSDVALATRVLNGHGRSRLMKRGGPAAGHRSDPDWQPEDEYSDLEDDLEDGDDDEKTGPVVVTSKPSRVRTVAVVTSVAEEAEPDYLDVDIVDPDSGALTVGSIEEPIADELPLEFASAETDLEEPAEEIVEEPVALDEDAALDDDLEDGTADEYEYEYEYVEDTSGLESEEEPATAMNPAAARSQRYERSESKTAAAVSARKYTFRRRMLTSMAVVLIFLATAAFLLTPTAWYACGAVGAVTLLYLAYLRRQTRIEERLRRRRMQRMARARLGVENTVDREFEVVPSRLRRPGAVVLEIDDEDPEFEHLDSVAFAREYDLPRAAGQ